MKKVVIRKLFINFEKEEKWLNDMAALGLHFINYSIGRYVFEKGKPGEYTYRLELLDNLPNHPESQAYIEFMEGSGIECVDTYLRWVYFRKPSIDGVFDLYSDYDSRIKHYKKVALLVGVIGGLNLVIAIANLMNGISGEKIIAYASMMNWLVVIAFTPMFVSYLRSMYRLKKAKQLYE